MVFKKGSKGEEGSSLLSVKKRSEDVLKGGRPKLGKRLSAIFKKPNEKHQQFKNDDGKDDGKDDVTPPPSPDTGSDDGPLTVSLMATAYPELSPPHREDDEDERSNSGTTISDLSASVKRFKGKPYQSPMKEVEEEPKARDTAEPTKSTLTTYELAKERKNADSYSPDSVVASLFGSDSGSRATGRSYPTWGTAPSEDDDTNFASTIGTGTQFTEDKTLFSEEIALDAEAIRDDLESKASTKASTKVSTKISLLDELDIDPPEAAPAPVSPGTSHENFELILDPAALKSDPAELKSVPHSTPKRKTLNWMRNKSSLVEEKKNKDDAGARRKQFKTTVSSTKKSPFVKRLVYRNANAAKEAAKKASIVVKEYSSARKFAANTNLTDELLDEGELLGEEILEENEGSVLSATYTEVASIGSIIGIKASKETKKDANDTSEVATQIKDAPKAASFPSVTPEKHNTEKQDPFDNTPRASNVNIGDNRSRSWNVLTKALAKRRSKREGNKDFMSRTVSSPMRLSEKKANTVNLWKTAEDPNTGRTYYYHKLTRKTTWSKPKNYDAVLQQEQELRMSVKLQSKKALGSQEHSKAVPSDIVPASDMSIEDNSTPYRQPRESILKKLSRGDSDRSVMAKKQEITRLLTQMAPPDDSSVVNLMEQYRGREGELLIQLRDLVKSQPFDEPVKNASSFASDISESRSLTKTRTSNTTNTGMSARTEQTQRIKNTAKPGYVFEAIKESDENFDDESISSNNLSTLTDPATPDRSESKQKRSMHSSVQTDSPTGRTTERTRDLHVEEFSSSRLNVENYDKQATVRTARQRKMDAKRRLSAKEPRTYAPPTRANVGADSVESEYSGGEDSDIETYTDTVSALSFTEPEYTNRKDNFDQARRKALDEAIRQRDWELAASVAENMRMRTMDDNSEPSDQYQEWTQSELDKFISENDWDAVASYIAQMRDSGKAYAARMIDQEGKERGPNGKDGIESEFDKNVQKRFGARSQLQHTEGEHSISSWDSESFYESEDGSSSSSSVSFENIHKLVRKEFAC